MSQDEQLQDSWLSCGYHVCILVIVAGCHATLGADAKVTQGMVTVHHFVFLLLRRRHAGWSEAEACCTTASSCSRRGRSKVTDSSTYGSSLSSA